MIIKDFIKILQTYDENLPIIISDINVLPTGYETAEIEHSADIFSNKNIKTINKKEALMRIFFTSVIVKDKIKFMLGEEYRIDGIYSLECLCSKVNRTLDNIKKQKLDIEKKINEILDFYTKQYHLEAEKCIGTDFFNNVIKRDISKLSNDMREEVEHIKKGCLIKFEKEKKAKLILIQELEQKKQHIEKYYQEFIKYVENEKQIMSENYLLICDKKFSNEILTDAWDYNNDIDIK